MPWRTVPFWTLPIDDIFQALGSIDRSGGVLVGASEFEKRSKLTEHSLSQTNQVAGISARC